MISRSSITAFSMSPFDSFVTFHCILCGDFCIAQCSYTISERNYRRFCVTLQCDFTMSQQTDELHHSLNCLWFPNSFLKRHAAHDVLMPVLLHCDTSDRIFWDRLGTRSRFHFPAVIIHGNDGPPGLIFTLLFLQCGGEYGSSPSCSVRTGLGMACVLLHALLSPSALACSWVLLSLANLALRTLIHLPFCLLLHLTCHYVLLQSRSTLSLHTILILSFPLLQV